MNTLQPGDTGRDVEVWQRFLAQVWAGELDSMLPGVFDERTEEATRLFQERYGVEANGLVDRETFEKAQLLGYRNIDALVEKGLTKSTLLAGFVILVAVSLLSQCMLFPGTGRTYRGYALPLNPQMVPSARPGPTCPGWFC